MEPVEIRIEPTCFREIPNIHVTIACDRHVLTDAEKKEADKRQEKWLKKRRRDDIKDFSIEFALRGIQFTLIIWCIYLWT